MGPWQQRQLTEEIISDYGLSVAGACQLTGLTRSQFYYRSRKDDSEVIAALQELAAAHPTYGFRKLLAYLRRAGRKWNHKRVYRVYRLLKLWQEEKGQAQAAGTRQATAGSAGRTQQQLEYGFYE